MGVVNGGPSLELGAGTDFLEDLLREPLSSEPAQRIELVRHRLRTGTWLSEVFAGLVGGGFLVTISSSKLIPGILGTLGFLLLWRLSGTIAGTCTDLDARPWTTTLRIAKVTAGMGLADAWVAFGWLEIAGGRHPAVAALSAAAAAATTAVAGRGAMQALVFRSRGLAQRTLIIGSGVVAGEIVERLALAPYAAIDMIGLVDDDVHHESSPLLPVLGGLDDLEETLERYDVDRVIIAFTRSGHDQLLRAIRTCWDRRVAIDVVPRLFEFLDGARTVDRVGGLPMLSITVPSLSRSARLLKRSSDILTSIAILVLASPLLALIALLIKLDSPGPVLFRQERVGRHGSRFRMTKFRSMYVDADERKGEFAALNDLGDGVMFKIHDDPRITRLGRFLRRSSLDEIPQLYNVLLGQMSLVGPRPLIPEEVEAFDESWHRRRLDLRPGMTGPWQIYGRSNIPFRDMLRFDYQYVAGWSLGRDIEILLSTVPAALSGRGAY